MRLGVKRVRYYCLAPYVALIIIVLLQACQNSLKIETDKKAAQYNMQLGLAYLAQGNMALAKNKLLRSLNENPKSADVNAAMAYFMEKVGEFEKAEYYYQKAQLLAPKNSVQLNNYGAYLYRRGNYQKALRYFMLAVNDVNYEHTAMAYENAGLCNIALKYNKKAVFYFKKSLLQDRSRARSLKEIVNIELRENNTLDACKYLKRYNDVVVQNIELFKIEKKFCLEKHRR